MLFDLRGRGRRRVIQVIYLGLALLLGGGLVFFGIGGSTSGGLLDAFKNGGGGGGSNVVQKQVNKAARATRLRPSSPAAWATLARSEFQIAGLGDNYNQAAQFFTAKGLTELGKAASAWDSYIALNPPHPDANLANQMVIAYSALRNAPKAVSAMEIVVANQKPASAALYGRLAELAYAAGQSRKGDLSAAKAVALSPKDQRPSVQASLQQAKAQGTGSAAQGATQGAVTTGG